MRADEGTNGVQPAGPAYASDMKASTGSGPVRPEQLAAEFPASVSLSPAFMKSILPLHPSQAGPAAPMRREDVFPPFEEAAKDETCQAPQDRSSAAAEPSIDPTVATEQAKQFPVHEFVIRRERSHIGSGARRRGIQEHQVWGAADALLREGLRPTIERVRMKIGGGSPNTVSPMLERWFATLGTRLTPAPNPNLAATPSTVADAPTHGKLGSGIDSAMPSLVSTLARELWEGVHAEACRAIVRYEEDLRAEEQVKSAQFEARCAQLLLEQASFAQVRVGIENALTVARQSLHAMQDQLEQVSRARYASERELASLKQQLAQWHSEQERTRPSFAQEQKDCDTAAQEVPPDAAAREMRPLVTVDSKRAADLEASAQLLGADKNRVWCEEAFDPGGCAALKESRSAVIRLRRELASVRNQLRGALDAATACANSSATVALDRLHDLQLALESQARSTPRASLAAAQAKESEGKATADAQPSPGLPTA